EALYLTSLEKRFNPAITHEPRYIGKTSSIGTSTGIANIQISGSTIRAVQAQRGDWVAYIGPNSGIWETGLLMSWTGFAWEQVNPDNSDNTHLYMGALKDIFEGAPNARYSVAFIKTLFAQTIFADLLKTYNIRLERKQIDGQWREGTIQSDNFTENGTDGFRIRHNGDVEFRNGKFKGHIEANSGYINNMDIDNVTIGNEAIFLGTIKSGPVFISNETTVPVPPQIFSANTLVRDLIDTLGRNITINVSTGTFGSKHGLLSIITTYWSQTYPTFPPSTSTTYTLRFIFNDGTTQDFSAQNPNHNWNSTIGQQLSIGGSIAGKIFIIENLPTGSSGLPAGSVYRNGNQLMIA
ncbi:MAG: DUF3672 domain-containing protein, partial [Treponema sp.]|nr:DUF3672 domain-containing protein [Treponema sp.]